MPRSEADQEPLTPGPRTVLLTYAEAGEQLRIHARTVRDWADEGRLVKVTLGPQTLRVTAQSVEELIARSVATA